MVHDSFFDTVTVDVPGQASAIAAHARDLGINLRLVDDDTLGISLDETTTRATVEAVWSAFGVAGSIDDLDASTPDAIPATLARTSEILTHPVFHRYHSETEMLRYLRRLADRDLALDRTMIPLGSCTMKLNATTEMIPVTWPEFGELHPFAPAEQTQGYVQLFDDLEAWLCEITGYDAVSLQPNAGSQGELAGLLAIRAYHHSRGDTHRNVCLIPASAHGTNAASAVMAGMRVVVVACDSDGNVDVTDLKAKANDHAEDLAALMVTYPSTHGVFEEQIGDVCAVVHECGGQVYLDGANLNALVGLAKPGKFGADVSHLNLHKTFCIPHGGGGPGVGPVGVRSHLAPFLPNHPLRSDAGPDTGVGPISAAPWGSAGILPISWAYMQMMGGAGLARATQVAILNANYVAQARRLLPGALRRARRPRCPRVHPGPPTHHASHRGHGRGHRKAPDRLRLPRADDVVPGRRHAHGRADGVGGQARARPLLRRDDRHPRRDPARSKRGSGRPQTARCAAHRIRLPTSPSMTGTMPTPATTQRSPWRHCATTSTGRPSAASTTSTATATSSAPAHPSRPTRRLTASGMTTTAPWRPTGAHSGVERTTCGTRRRRARPSSQCPPSLTGTRDARGPSSLALLDITSLIGTWLLIEEPGVLEELQEPRSKPSIRELANVDPFDFGGVVAGNRFVVSVEQRHDEIQDDEMAVVEVFGPSEEALHDDAQPGLLGDFRTTASCSVSPSSTRPPGTDHVPAAGPCPRRTSSSASPRAGDAADRDGRTAHGSGWSTWCMTSAGR